jgi:uncharacterized membrane protein YkvA (DUF1232 family)
MRRPKPQPKVGWLRALARYYRDREASVFGKLIALVAIVYVVCPIDLIPDVPVVGWLDDLGVMGLATAWLVRVVARYRAPDTLRVARPASPTLALDGRTSTLT